MFGRNRDRRFSFFTPTFYLSGIIGRLMRGLYIWGETIKFSLEFPLSNCPSAVIKFKLFRKIFCTYCVPARFPKKAQFSLKINFSSETLQNLLQFRKISVQLYNRGTCIVLQNTVLAQPLWHRRNSDCRQPYTEVAGAGSPRLSHGCRSNRSAEHRSATRAGPLVGPPHKNERQNARKVPGRKKSGVTPAPPPIQLPLAKVFSFGPYPLESYLSRPKALSDRLNALPRSNVLWNTVLVDDCEIINVSAHHRLLLRNDASFFACDSLWGGEKLSGRKFFGFSAPPPAKIFGHTKL